MIAEQTQHVAKIVVRRSKLGIEAHGLLKDLARLAGRALLQQCDAQVVHRADVLRIERKPGAASLDGAGRVPEAPMGLAQMRMEVRVPRECDCPHDPLDCELRVPGLHGQDPREMESVSIIWLALKHCAIEPVCFRQAPALMMRQRLGQGIRDGEFLWQRHSSSSS
ncbi:MAG TPA: hypothetical protein VKS22_15460 [Candidatus Binataceae bacterium]|nr:hypothetical protein [Candidatus Binataceae bacterium]